MTTTELESTAPQRGRIIVIAGPSGVGKGTICKMLLETLPKVCLSVSATTRGKREGEVHGEAYFFLSRDEFEQMAKAGDMLEYAEYNQCYYGTPRFYVEEKLDQGQDVLLEIETRGALDIKEKFPKDAFMIFLMPPSMDVLRKRLMGRGTNTEADVDSRMAIAEREMAVRDQFNFQVVNDDLAQCHQEVLRLLQR